MRYFFLITLFSVSAYSQVPFPFNASSAGAGRAERIASFTVSGAGNDRVEITNDTDFDGQFAPTLWSYRDTDNRQVFSIKSSIPGTLDNGTAPIMLFATSINNTPQFNAPGTGDFPWGNAGTALNIVNRPLFQWRNNSLRIMTMIPNGNVGIGTITPTARLHNNGSVRFENLGTPASPNPSFILGTDAIGNVFQYNTSLFSGTADADWLKPNGTVAMSINDDIYTNGRVGINAQNPTANFHLNGTARFENLANATNPNFLLGTDANGNMFEYNPAAFTPTSDADWLKPDGSIPNSINDNIYTNGMVGINVQNPTANLHSNGSLRFENLVNATNPNYILGTDANGNVSEYDVTSLAGTSDADWLKPDGSIPNSINDNIYTNGMVGINVQNPTANLHSNGSLRFENLVNAANPNYILGTDANGNVSEYDVTSLAGTSDADWLKPDGNLAMSINDNIYTNGKVGIGISTFPTLVGTEDVSFYNLYVKGGLLTEEVRVALTSDWADYVFKKDYKLPTLKEVEKHIKDKGHLQDIPSAKEVKDNGVELGEMNKLLLQKVEELTLYIIDLNKKVEAQQKQIETLVKSKNEK